jgi:DNA-binding transcriptional ArsR family regulator
MTELLDRTTAAEYASWFRALADPTRVQIVEYLARQGRPLSVGELTAAVGLAQSTVSQHLKILTEVRFVLVEPVGTARHYRINERCIARAVHRLLPVRCRRGHGQTRTGTGRRLRMTTVVIECRSPLID